jgi:hypothetical protein
MDRLKYPNADEGPSCIQRNWQDGIDSELDR